VGGKGTKEESRGAVRAGEEDKECVPQALA
jgi:hypothetical protein